MGPGELFLVYNDCAGYYGNNTGSFQVKVTLQNREVSGTVSVLCKGAARCGPRIPLANATIHVRGRQTFSATTDSRGKYSVSVPRGSYILGPGLGGGYS